VSFRSGEASANCYTPFTFTFTLLRSLPSRRRSEIGAALTVRSASATCRQVEMISGTVVISRRDADMRAPSRRTPSVGKLITRPARTAYRSPLLTAIMIITSGQHQLPTKLQSDMPPRLHGTSEMDSGYVPCPRMTFNVSDMAD